MAKDTQDFNRPCKNNVSSCDILDKKLDLILDSKNSFHLFSFSKSLYKSILSPT